MDFKPGVAFALLYCVDVRALECDLISQGCD